MRNRIDMSAFVKERDKAFTDFVLNDDICGILAYCVKWGIPMPDSMEVFKAGIYKAVSGCIDIPDDVKAIAKEKCIALGFNPEINA